MSKGGNRVPENFTIEQANDLTQEKSEPLRFFMYDESPTLAMPGTIENITVEQGSLLATNSKNRDGSMVALTPGNNEATERKRAASTRKGK